MNNNVYIIKNNSYKTAIREVLKSITYEVLESVKKYPFITIKPNFLSVERTESSTNPILIEEVLKWLRTFYKGKIILAEGSPQTPEIIKKFKISALAHKYKVKIVNLKNENNWTSFKAIDQYKRPINIRYPADIAQSYIISLAVPKMHGNSGVSLSIKNTMGLLHIKDKKLMHGLVDDVKFAERAVLSSHWWEKHSKLGFIFDNLYGVYFRVIGRHVLSSFKKKVMIQNYYVLSQNIYSLSRVLQPSLSIIDGFGCMEGQGPWFGTIKNLHTIVASINAAAADLTMASIMSLSIDEVAYLFLLKKKNKSKLIYPIRSINSVRFQCYNHCNFSIQKDWKKLI